MTKESSKLCITAPFGWMSLAMGLLDLIPDVKQPDCFFNSLLRRTSRETSKLCFTASLWWESTSDKWSPLIVSYGTLYPTARPFLERNVRANNKENVTAPHHWPFVRETAGPAASQTVSNAQTSHAMPSWNIVLQNRYHFKDVHAVLSEMRSSFIPTGFLCKFQCCHCHCMTRQLHIYPQWNYFEKQQDKHPSKSHQVINIFAAVWWQCRHIWNKKHFCLWNAWLKFLHSWHKANNFDHFLSYLSHHSHSD